MPLSMKLILLASLVFLVLINLSDSVLLRIAYGLFIVLVGISFMGFHESVAMQLRQCRKEIERLNQVCEELDQNTKLIVQTDLELTRTQEALDKKLSSLYALHDISKKIIAARSVESLSKLVAEMMVTSLDVEKSIFYLNASGNEHKTPLVSYAGFAPDEWSQVDIHAVSEQLAVPIYRPGEALFVEEADPNSGVVRVQPKTVSRQAVQSIAASIGARSFIAVPIVLEGQPQGFLMAATNPPYPPLDTGDVEWMSILVSELVVAIENLRLYEALRRSHEELEERVKLRTQELAKANEELIRLNKMKSDFVSAVSHELRTPLTSIKGYTALVKAGKLGPVTSEQSARLEKILHHTDFLTDLISELLDIARIESGRVGMDIQPVDLTQILETVEDLMAPQMKEKDLHFHLKIPSPLPTLMADGDHLKRVFLNLLSNAIRFTPPKGTIAIEAIPEEAHLKIIVSDTGIGMTKDDLSHLFTEFFRADNPVNREKKGTGLGLVLVKRIVEAHGGKIHVESEWGRGTTFIITLPWRPMSLASSSDRASPDEGRTHLGFGG